MQAAIKQLRKKYHNISLRNYAGENLNPRLRPHGKVRVLSRDLSCYQLSMSCFISMLLYGLSPAICHLPLQFLLRQCSLAFHSGPLHPFSDGGVLVLCCNHKQYNKGGDSTAQFCEQDQGIPGISGPNKAKDTSFLCNFEQHQEVFQRSCSKSAAFFVFFLFFMPLNHVENLRISSPQEVYPWCA